ncbi:methyltransferase domain-containing protein [Parasalinivibrio latis]|uniref:MerR family transcriptional regulator n=1 Tax=Parasalinivibrio latis TaxID=2952610 RepID=UPI0030E14ABC
MYRISELADRVGLSRTALLYYEKLGLIEGQRQGNGYRAYSERDVQRVKLIQQLQAGGLTLKECLACLDAKVDRSLLLNRLGQLDEEIARKQQARELLAALLGESGLRDWHESLDKVAPDAHLEWLIRQGFDEKQALHLKWLSKDMNTHEQYMADFMRVFNGLERWGPGSEDETLRALEAIPFKPKRILEIGCGNGIATSVLAEHTEADITAVDTEQPALDRLSQKASKLGFGERIKPVNACMTDLPFEADSFDVVWAEGCAYIMGIANAFESWCKLLSKGGVLVLSDMVWLSEKPNEEAKAFFQREYPDMTSVDKRLKQANSAGYEVVEHFSLSHDAWDAYYTPLEEKVEALKPEVTQSTAISDLETELNVYHKHLGDFGYQVFVLKKI